MHRSLARVHSLCIHIRARTHTHTFVCEYDWVLPGPPLAMDPAAFLGPAARRKTLLSKALIDVVGAKNRNTDATLAALLMAKRGDGKKRKAELECADAKTALLDATTVESKGPTTKGGEASFVLAKPGRYLQVLRDNCPGFKTLLWELVTARDGQGLPRQVLGARDRPLLVIMREGNTTPGNAQDAANPRKHSAWYWSLRNFSKWLLCQDWGWFHCMATLTREINQLDGGKSALCDLVLREFWVHESLARAGFRIDFGNCELRLFFAYDSFLADLDSHRECWGWVAAGGTRFCWKCKNALRKSANVQSAYFVDTGCADFRRFDAQTDAEAYHSADTLASLFQQAQYKWEKKKGEELYGLHHIPRGPLLDMDLREVVKPVTGARVDGMHTWFSQGLVQHEVQLFMADAEKLRPPISFKDLNDFCNHEWKFPGFACSPRNFVADLFREAKITDQGKPRLWASEALVVTPVLRHWAETVVARHPESAMMA